MASKDGAPLILLAEIINKNGSAELAFRRSSVRSRETLELQAHTQLQPSPGQRQDLAAPAVYVITFPPNDSQCASTRSKRSVREVLVVTPTSARLRLFASGA